MRDTFLSNCEKNFVQKLISEGHRLDGRTYDESRTLDIQIGSEYGSCIVSLGETKVLAQVSCEVVQPKQIRPNEGIIYINVEIGPMAAPQFEANRQTDLGVYLNRLLEKCYKDSKCIDLESLCIVVEEKVWSLRVDVKILNHDGNLIECASIATLTSLAHFKRPDVTRSGDSVIIHTMAEKDPIPTVLYHYPVCVSFALYNDDILLTDPTLLEEAVCSSGSEESSRAVGALVAVGVNQYRELCLLELRGAAGGARAAGGAARAAAARVPGLVRRVKAAVADDDATRQKRKKINFSDLISDVPLMSLSREPSIRLKNYNVDNTRDKIEEDMKEDLECSKYEIVSKKPDKADVVSKSGVSTWVEISSESEDD